MSHSHRSLLAALTVLAALAATASVAPAAQRYASPTGSGPACSSADPCSITQAIDDAIPGDEVVVTSGEYTLTESPPVANQIAIHGVAGRPRPRLRFEGNQSGMLLPVGTLLRYVEIEQAATSSLALSSNGAKVEQVVVKGPAGASCTAFVTGSTIRNSLFVGPGSGGSVVCVSEGGAGPASWLRNVTAIATDSGGVAIEAIADGASGKTAAELVNVIAKGGAGGAGLAMRTDSSGAEATITARNTNFANYWTSGTKAHYVNGGGNQGTPPHFVSPATGNYRQAPDSVTIGAGLDEPINGAFDLDGDPRAIGTTDIGADEFVFLPAATTGPAVRVVDRSATLRGSVDPRGAPTSYHFEYGTTTAYGQTTGAVSAGSGTGAVASGAPLDGLTPGTTYHFRLVASNAGGDVRGGDRTFTTASSASPPTPWPTTPSATTQTPAFAGVKLVSTRLRFARGFVTAKLECPAATVGRCVGRTKLTVRRPRTIRLGRATFSIMPGREAKVRIRVSRTGRQLIRRARRLPGTAVNVAHSDSGELETTVTAVTIRRRRA